MTRKVIVMSTLLVALALSTIPAAARDAGDPYEGTESPEEAQCPPWTWYVPENAEEESYPVYIVKDDYHYSPYPPIIGEMWIYAESNGMQGLQRYDGYCTNEGADNVDAYRDVHDMIIW